MKTRLGTLLVFLVLAGIGISASATVNAQGPKVLWHVIAGGGVVAQSVGNDMKMSATIGQAVVGWAADGTNKHFVGFWGPIEASATGVNEDNAVVSGLSNYPNPFAYQTTISYVVPQSATVTIRIVDMVGREIRTLANNEFFEKGAHSMQWDAKDDAGADVAAGQYICEMSVTSNGDIMKSHIPMMLVK